MSKTDFWICGMERRKHCKPRSTIKITKFLFRIPFKNKITLIPESISFAFLLASIALLISKPSPKKQSHCQYGGLVISNDNPSKGKSKEHMINYDKNCKPKHVRSDSLFFRLIIKCFLGLKHALLQSRIVTGNP